MEAKSWSRPLNTD